MLLDSEYLRLDRPEMTAARAPPAAVAARSVLDVLDPDGAHGGVQRGGGRRGFLALLVSEWVVNFVRVLDRIWFWTFGGIAYVDFTVET